MARLGRAYRQTGPRWWWSDISTSLATWICWHISWYIRNYSLRNLLKINYFRNRFDSCYRKPLHLRLNNKGCLISTKAYQEHRYETFNETCSWGVSKIIHYDNNHKEQTFNIWWLTSALWSCSELVDTICPTWFDDIWIAKNPWHLVNK